MARGYVPNPTFAAQVAASPQMRAMLEKLARDGAARVREASPYRQGDYRRGITFKVELVSGRWVGRIIAGHWSSSLIEWGSVNNPPFAPLRRGVDALGLRMRSGA